MAASSLQYNRHSQMAEIPVLTSDYTTLVVISAGNGNRYSDTRVPGSLPFTRDPGTQSFTHVLDLFITQLLSTQQCHYGRVACVFGVIYNVYHVRLTTHHWLWLAYAYLLINMMRETYGPCHTVQQPAPHIEMACT